MIEEVFIYTNISSKQASKQERKKYSSFNFGMHFIVFKNSINWIAIMLRKWILVLSTIYN